MWVRRLKPLTPQVKKNSVPTLVTLPCDSPWSQWMKIGLQLSYHDAAAQNGEMPPTMWWDHILISLSIFDAVPRHLGDKFVIINSTFKAVERSYPIFSFQTSFCGSSAPEIVFQEQCWCFVSKVHYWRSCVHNWWVLHYTIKVACSIGLLCFPIH